IITYGINTLRLILRILVMILILKLGGKSVAIVLTDLSISLAVWLYIMFYGRFKLKEKAKYHKFDGQLLKQCFVFSLAIFLQRIINQVNQNLDNVILGMMTNTAIVAMYSIALTIFTSFNSIVSTIGTLFTPRATQIIANNATGEELTDFISKTGRLQFMIAGLIITGFGLFGKNFIMLWVGSKYISVYYLSIILLIPAAIPLITSVSSSILDAMLKRLGASIILGVMCIVNIGVSVVLIEYIGFWGAAIGTAVSFIIGHGILFNIYLHKVAGIKIFKMYGDIIDRSIFGVLACFAIGIPLTYLPNNVWCFILKVLIYSIVYSFVMYRFCMNDYEKKIAKSFVIFRKNTGK
ncbi:MAG: polysaccharide biosynthesis C-terminal domain-containing protein, partial [Clostridia bacterium]|nr:polysaccharide biosynthesis C-terminal domain-containing protein [Clostridia bacterium]